MYLYNYFNDNYVKAKFLIFYHLAKTYLDNIEYVFDDKGIINLNLFTHYISDYHDAIDQNDEIG